MKKKEKNQHTREREEDAFSHREQVGLVRPSGNEWGGLASSLESGNVILILFFSDFHPRLARF